MGHTSFIKQKLSQASLIAQSHFGQVSNISVKSQDNNQVLTEADLEIGKFLVTAVQEAYPDFNVIDEEAGVVDKGANQTWVIDPIDGTSNFAQGLPMYGVMIGLLQDNQPIAGGIALPAFDQIIVAEKGSGAFLNDQPVSISKEENLLNCLVAYGIDGHQENPTLTQQEAATLGEIILSIRNLRSSNSAYDMVLTAAGKYGGLLNQTSKIWDNVAAQIIIEEAGGIYTDFWGQPVDYSTALSNPEANFSLCAASPALHAQLQFIIHQSRESQVQ